MNKTIIIFGILIVLSWNARKHKKEKSVNKINAVIKLTIADAG